MRRKPAPWKRRTTVSSAGVRNGHVLLMFCALYCVVRGNCVDNSCWRLQPPSAMLAACAPEKTYSTGAHCLNEWNNQWLMGGRSPCLLDHCGDKGMWLCTPIPVYHIDRIPCDVMLSCGASTCTRNAFRLKLLSRLHVIPLEPAAQTLAHIQIPCRLVMSTGIQ